MKNDMTVKYSELMLYLQRHGSAKVTELAEALFLSEATVRRVLRILETEGKLRRYHGGAALLDPETQARVKQREVSNLREKETIGALAASLVEDGMTLLLMGGTTVAAMCPYLRGKKLTIITSSLPVVSALAFEERMQVIVLGGVLNPPEMEVRGGLTQLTLEHLRADMMFSGTTGLHPIHGVMTDDPNGVDAYIKCMHISDEVIVLADHTKCERYGGTTVWCALSSIHGLVLDSGTDEKELTYYRQQVQKVYVAQA